jgi:BirA family biotin operon repressor/biotin-[acetyl-CoA-carboxylase] ligase
VELLNLKKIGRYLKASHQKIIDDTIIFTQLPSTNAYLLDLAEEEKNCTICFAEKQSAGKGRRGRNWFSPFGCNIYLSILWQFSRSVSELGGLGLAIAVTAVKALKFYGIKEDLSLKWPNDILWRNKKLCGILIENKGIKTVIGIGINIKMPRIATKEISQPWIDVAQIINKIPDRNKIAGLLLDELLGGIEIFEDEGLIPFLDTWCKLDVASEKEVVIITPDGEIRGKGKGVNVFGHFLLEDQFGKIYSFSGGEVSLNLLF